MTAPTESQMIKSKDGKPASVVLSYAEFMALCGEQGNLIPNEVVGATVQGATPACAWRQYLGLTRLEVAQRMGITLSAYAKLEKSINPRPTTIARIAVALGITREQLDF
ncbi:DNA-binding protein [Herbaspirillum rubrisubalbicans]|uniref:DNA-binding protein n=2 Tax=Herbaspirillum rubrisubalbicans TaxID=80842 RepID=A0ABX9BXQ8_9BURK|nr:helix-turn-helix transcriptional regulator [Herbaspirillum rubrisubalbicans]RAM62762.1 DNA-binding protein [Herbaspirillum rubrisubalbicans]RAN49349.1 DNA-binding protein [Herbaspirillum rubrisubalbicans]